MAKIPRFILVMSLSPRGDDGGFTRAGLRFTRKWRLLAVGGTCSRDKDGHVQGGVIDTAVYYTLLGEANRDDRPMLALKPATDEEAALYAKELAEGPKDKDAEIADLKTKNADLEARMMRLELAAQGGKATAKSEQPKG